jgi:hypothetical protein
LQLHRWPLVSGFKAGCHRFETQGQPFFSQRKDPAADKPQNAVAPFHSQGRGERRRRTLELQFALPPVATRNGLALATANRRARKREISCPFTHKLCYRPNFVF